MSRSGNRGLCVGLLIWGILEMCRPPESVVHLVDGGWPAGSRAPARRGGVGFGAKARGVTCDVSGLRLDSRRFLL